MSILRAGLGVPLTIAEAEAPFSIGGLRDTVMRVERASDLIYWTYHMINWDKVTQTPSDQKCSECGKPMNKAEQAIDSKGHRYDGYVCHTEKRVIWVKSG